MAVKAGQGRKKPPSTNDEGEGGEGGEGGEDGQNYVTEEQLNAAVTKAISRFGNKTLPKILEKQLTETLSKAGFKAQVEGEGEGEDEGEDEGEGEEPPTTPKKPAAQDRPRKERPEQPAAPSPESKKLQRLQREMDELKKEREEAARKAAADEEKSLLREQLTAAGVRKEMVGPLTAWMLGEDSGRLVRRNSEGKVVFLQGESDDADEVPVKDGLAAWLKTDTGKTYLAPRQVGGAGMQMPGAQRPVQRPAAGGGQDRASADDELFGAVMGVVAGGVPTA